MQMDCKEDKEELKSLTLLAMKAHMQQMRPVARVRGIMDVRKERGRGREGRQRDG
jgi:hypothetical protein